MKARGTAAVAIALGLFVAGGCSSETSDGSSTSAVGVPGTGSTSLDSVGETTGASPVFPIRIEDGTLVDSSDEPFLIAGDAAWSLIAQLDAKEIEHYLDVRRQQGFNTLIVNLVEAYFADDPPRTTDGLEPFLSPGDWTTPNPDYFDRAAAILQQAADRGFLVLLFPAYLGFEGGDEGFYREMEEQGPEAMQQYGAWIGRRFRDQSNIVWVNGGDFEPPPAGLELVQAVADGIHAEDPVHLHTAHYGPESGGSDLDVDFLDLDTTYSWFSVGGLATAHYLRGGPPRFVIESTYEGDNIGASSQRIRAQGYEAMLTGGLGYVFGNTVVWHFPDDWDRSLETPGASGMSHLFGLFREIGWNDLVPDVDHQVLVEGPGQVGDWDYAPTAMSEHSIVIYNPNGSELTVALGADRAATFRWFDPTDGSFTEPQAVVPDTSDLVTFEAPGDNAASDQDWVLLIDLGNGQS